MTIAIGCLMMCMAHIAVGMNHQGLYLRASDGHNAGYGYSKMEQIDFLLKPTVKTKTLKEIADELQNKTQARSTGDLQCGVTEKVHSKDDKWVRCPLQCPLIVQDKTDDRFCSFRCVTPRPGDCAKWNPDTPIVDMHMGLCRSCMVSGCGVCNTDGTDTCAKCNFGYMTLADGTCFSKIRVGLYIILGIFGIAVVFIIVWIVDLTMRPITNGEGASHAMRFRNRQLFHTHVARGRELWGITTNLCYEQVGGPGLSLHFRFQFAVIIWALILGLAWALMAAVVDTDLFVLGTRRFGTPRQNCILVAWGYETQQRLMWTKVSYCIFAYIVTFFLCLWFGVRQLLHFQTLDLVDTTVQTMKDYSAMCVGLPSLKGATRAEELLKESVANATGTQVVGVSICWDYFPHTEKIMQANKLGFQDATCDEEESEPDVAEGASEHREEPKFVRASLLNLEAKLLGQDEAEELAATLTPRHELKGLLEQIESSEHAFVVFETQEQRDRAIQIVKDNGGTFQHEGVAVRLMDPNCQPGTVIWENFGHVSLLTKLYRLCVGGGAIFGGLLFWVVIFYAPYAWFVCTFNYSNGRQPGMIVGLAFSMVVVMGNAIMYQVCAFAAKNLGLRFSDTEQACYMLSYNFACCLNVALDMATTYVIAASIVEGLGFRTYHGKKLEDIEGYTEHIESYAMQRMLAENLYAYAWPSTFLIPFLIEPLPTVFVPLWLMQYIVRSNRAITGTLAEDYLAAFEFDLGRYADITLDTMLAVGILFFPGGYTTSMFLFLALSHGWIYLWDHYKVLRHIPAVSYATMDVDWWAQALLSVPTGLILSCIIFKANCKSFSNFCLSDSGTWQVCIAAFFVHVIVHLLLLQYVVPLFGMKASEGTHYTLCPYKEVSANEPSSWFNMNPVHCLRSQLIYQHNPPCSLLKPGKEHLLKPNPEIGLYFQDERASVSYGDVADLKRQWTKAHSDITRGASEVFKNLKRKPFTSAESAESTPS